MDKDQTSAYIKTLPTLQDEVYVFDNIIPNKAQTLIYSLAIQELDWKIGGNIQGTSGFNLDNDKMSESFQFTSLILDQTASNIKWCGFGVDGQRDRFDYNFMLPMQFGAMRLGSKVSIRSTLRCKLNFQTRVLPHKKNKYNLPHTDFASIDGSKYFTAIYYVNDSDGDTFIFNEKHQVGKIADEMGNMKEDYRNKIQNLTVRKRITPKKGTIIIFRGDTLHAGCHPVDNDYRCVINFNFFPKSLIDYNSNHDLEMYRRIFGDTP